MQLKAQTGIGCSDLLGITLNSLNWIMRDVDEQPDVARAQRAAPNERCQQPCAAPMLPNAQCGKSSGERREQYANPEENPWQIGTLLEAQAESVQVAYIQDKKQCDRGDNRTDNGERSLHIV